MKLNHKTLSVLLGLGLASSASAANFVYITGSTAFRSVAFQAITNTFDAVPQIATRDGSAASGNNANWMLFHGNVGGVETWVDCHWSGSEDGIAGVAVPGPNPTWFLKTDGSVTYSISAAKPGSAETNASPTAPDLAFADSSQAVSLTRTPALVKMGTNAVPTGKIGIVPFVWAKNKNSNPSNSWTRLTNMTDAGSRLALGGPNIAALFTGDSSDTNQFVYVVGRNNRSGTRVNTLAANRYGINVSVDQFDIGGFPASDGTTLLLAENPDPNDGYNGGGDVEKALHIDGSCQQIDPIYLAATGNTKTNIGWIAIGYLGIGDANTLLSNGGIWMTYNGIPYSNGAVEEGQYSFWNYEYLFGRVGISGFQQTYGNQLGSIYVAKFAGGSNPANKDTSIGLQFMHATKPSDTGDPAHN
jgi:hypothetical protein